MLLQPIRRAGRWLPACLVFMLAVSATAWASAAGIPEPPDVPDRPGDTTPPENAPDIPAQIAQQAARAVDIEEVPLSPAVSRILDSPAITDEQRTKLRLFHGQWDDFTPESHDDQATLALMRFEVGSPLLIDPQTPARTRAEAALFRGEAEEALELLAEDESISAALLRAQAYEELGRLAESVAVLTPLRERFQHETIEDAQELTAAARAIVMLAHLEGRPSQDYRLALSMLAKAHEQVDPLYWPAHLAEAELLMTKDNRSEAFEALQETLALNPRSGEAWYWLGRLSVDGYNFDGATEASKHLRRINPLHPLADELDIRSFLRQRDTASARRVLNPALGAMPQRRELLALAAALEGMAYQDEALARALQRFDEATGDRDPGSPLALYTAGEYLATDRQYGPAETLLRQAIERSPNWPAPRLELGLLLMQSGDIAAARTELAHAARLDPFHKRVNNQLRLAENLLGVYKTLETDHFIIRYKPGIDEALARDMPGPLEEMYDEIAGIFQHHPPVKTQIDIMPDKSNFAVRITGMPDIWTIAAATGDCIALTPPRSGPDQADPFNWVNVLRHEYVHTVTLSQTHNRVPHWFTEACAVSVETTGRTYDTCQLLAWALQSDKLFDYDKINWGFIRPKTERDRPLAYAQADWMLEYIATAWSHQAIVDLLSLYREGVSDEDALNEVTGLTADQFMQRFKAWATEQVAAWGLDQHETSDRAAEVFASEASGVSVDELKSLLEEHGGIHPDLIRLIAKRYADGFDTAAAKQWVARYAAARPVDPWPHQVLAQLAFDLGQPEDALGPLQVLERSDNYTSVWSRKLAELHRAAGRLDAAYRAIERALHCEPYNASHRELAATLALQLGNFDTAAYHVEALEILEPDRAIHPTRLAVIYSKLNRLDDASAAAKRALELDPNAKVGRFVKPEPSATE